MAPALNVKAPHVPTLAYALIAVVVLLFLYHLAAGSRRRG